MNADTIPHVIANAFSLPTRATQIEALVGAAILKAERKAGHVAKIPTFPKLKLGVDKADTEHWFKKAEELVKLMEGQPPMGRRQLAEILKCSKEIAARRATFAVKIGLLRRIDSKTWKSGAPKITYEIATEGEQMLKIGWLSKAIAARKSGCTKISKAKEKIIRNQFIEMGKETT
jgi:predicted transcriptional regulator